MAFVIFSDYACAESGSVLSDGEDRLVYSTREQALAKYESRRELLLRAVGDEIAIIKANKHLEFNSPYIVWILMLDLPGCDCAVDAVDGYLAECVEANEHPERFLKQCVEKFDGWVFSEKGRKAHPVREVIDDLVEIYS